jgi:hypothetical protein
LGSPKKPSSFCQSTSRPNRRTRSAVSGNRCRPGCKLSALRTACCRYLRYTALVRLFRNWSEKAGTNRNRNQPEAKPPPFSSARLSHRVTDGVAYNSPESIEAFLTAWPFRRLRENPKAQNWASRTLFSCTFPSPVSIGTEICFGLPLAFPDGVGSVAILRSMPPNSRRVR